MAGAAVNVVLALAFFSIRGVAGIPVTLETALLAMKTIHMRATNIARPLGRDSRSCSVRSDG